MSMHNNTPTSKKGASSWVDEMQARKNKKRGKGKGAPKQGGQPPAKPKEHKPGNASLIYGKHPVFAALANPNRQCKRLWVTKNAAEHLPPLPAGLQPQIIDSQELSRKLLRDAVHQGLALEAAPLPEPKLEDCTATGKPIMILDQVTDPHNIGAILRSAAAFDAACVIVPKHHAPDETGVLAKSASGALEVVPLLHVPNLSNTLKTLKEQGYWCAGLDGTAPQTLKEAKLTLKTALIMGAEGKGLRRLTTENCDLLIKLPMSGKMESLNVSNAAAIALYELFSNSH